MISGTNERDFDKLKAVLKQIDETKTVQELGRMKNKNRSIFESKLTEARALFVKLEALEKMRLGCDFKKNFINIFSTCVGTCIFRFS